MNTRIGAKETGDWGRRWRRARQVLYDSLARFFAEDSLTISASIAYYLLLSVFPMMLMVLSLSGVYIRRYELSWRLVVLLENYLPMKPDFIVRNLVSISQTYGRVSLISLLLLLWSSSGVFLPLEKALNRAWDVERDRVWWRRHLLALEMAMIMGSLIFISSGLVGFDAAARQWSHGKLLHPSDGALDLGYHIIVGLISFVMTVAMFVVLFQRLPNRQMKFRQVIPSAALTALFWEAARSLFTLVLPHFNYRHVYGSIGAMVALMTWAYISSAVTLFGAQVSSALYRTLEPGEANDLATRATAVQPAGEVP